MARSPEENRAYMREYYQKNRQKWGRPTPEKRAEYNANRRAKYAQDEGHRAKINRKVKEFWDANPRKRKSQRIKAYALTLEQFDAMMAAQGGKCAICGHSDRSVPKFFPVIDHCHDTGLVRGLLCMNCNLAIGKLKDDPILLRRAAAYLEVNNVDQRDH